MTTDTILNCTLPHVIGSVYFSITSYGTEQLHCALALALSHDAPKGIEFFRVENGKLILFWTDPKSDAGPAGATTQKLPFKMTLPSLLPFVS